MGILQLTALGVAAPLPLYRNSRRLFARVCIRRIVQSIQRPSICPLVKSLWTSRYQKAVAACAGKKRPPSAALYAVGCGAGCSFFGRGFSGNMKHILSGAAYVLV